MDKETYDNTLATLLEIALQLRVLPLHECLVAIDRADTIGPVLDPTLYQVAHRSLDDTRQLVHAAREFQKVVVRLSTVAPHGLTL